MKMKEIAIIKVSVAGCNRAFIIPREVERLLNIKRGRKYRVLIDENKDTETSKVIFEPIETS